MKNEEDGKMTTAEKIKKLCSDIAVIAIIGGIILAFAMADFSGNDIYVGAGPNLAEVKKFNPYHPYDTTVFAPGDEVEYRRCAAEFAATTATRLVDGFEKGQVSNHEVATKNAQNLKNVLTELGFKEVSLGVFEGFDHRMIHFSDGVSKTGGPNAIEVSLSADVKTMDSSYSFSKFVIVASDARDIADSEKSIAIDFSDFTSRGGVYLLSESFVERFFSNLMTTGIDLDLMANTKDGRVGEFKLEDLDAFMDKYSYGCHGSYYGTLIDLKDDSLPPEAYLKSCIYRLSFAALCSEGAHGSYFDVSLEGVIDGNTLASKRFEFSTEKNDKFSRKLMLPFAVTESSGSIDGRARCIEYRECYMAPADYARLQAEFICPFALSVLCANNFS